MENPVDRFLSLDTQDQYKALQLLADSKKSEPVAKGAGDDYPIIKNTAPEQITIKGEVYSLVVMPFVGRTKWSASYWHIPRDAEKFPSCLKMAYGKTDDEAKSLLWDYIQPLLSETEKRAGDDYPIIEQSSFTTDRNNADLNVPKENGQNKAYLILSDEERAKGFVRPVRNKYIHVGRLVEREGTIRPLDSHPNAYHTLEGGYVAFLKYPESRLPQVGRYIKQDELDAINKNQTRIGGCGGLTKMAREFAETYARDPKFYGSTFCVHCGKHLPVAEFVWDNTNETVGS